MNTHYQIVIVGGGTAGITVAARLLNENSSLSVALIEPSDKHYYQPMWTLIGGGIFPKEESERNEVDYVPRGATWIQDAVAEFDPENNRVVTRDGKTVTYDFLVVAPGIQINWDKVKGLKESVGKNGVCSNYSFDTVDSTWENIRHLKSGTAIFTQPAGAIKCGGAPQKICYLAEDYFRKHGVRDKIDVVFTAAGKRIFAVDKYADALEKVVERKQIGCRFRLDLIEIRGDAKEAVFKQMDTGEQQVIKYDMIHVTPPMGPPEFVAKSLLADKEGWVEVDPHSLQHCRYPNVFSAGDASSLPTSKTGAAVRKQAPVLVENLLAQMNGKPLAARYDGYTSCPLVTGYDTMMLAEFDYDKQPAESFSFDQGRERFSMMLLKKYGLPALYWHGMLRGRA